MVDPPETPQNDKQANDARLERMVHLHFDVVWRSLRRLGVPDGAVDDAAQRVFMIAVEKLATIRPEGERAYLLGIALRVASDARRTVKRRREVSEEEAKERSDPQPSPEELVDRKRARELLDRILDTMPMDLRAAFAMFEIEGLSLLEVARALGTPPGTAASRVRRAREFFQKALRRFGYDPERGLGGGSYG
jgi:RNA polymerase sigma-70 factor (ECF subfamily)